MLEIQNTITEMKNAINAVFSGFNMAWRSVGDLEAVPTYTPPTLKCRENRTEKCGIEHPKPTG